MVGKNKRVGNWAPLGDFRALSASGDVRTQCRDVGVGGTLQCRLVDSMHIRKNFCDVPLRAIVAHLVCPPYDEGGVQSG